MTDEKEELMPCPFCGGTSIKLTTAVGESWASCSNCLANAKMCGTKEEAIKRWNIRSERCLTYFSAEDEPLCDKARRFFDPRIYLHNNEKENDMNEMNEMPPQQDAIMQYFSYDHLPPKLQEVSKPFCDLALHIQNSVPRNAERTVALRKLLEGKDAAVRASITE